MSRGIDQWLDGLGLGRYAEAFADNEIDLHALPHITEEDLKEIGVALGARRKLLAAIAELGDSDEPPTADERSDERSASAEAERRQLTVMFVDLVGSTALSQRLDPEDLRDVLRRYQDVVAAAVARYEGHVAKFLGDGVLAYFGWPQAYEDQAERAVRAGLGAVAAVEGVRLDGGERLCARVGIATGQVVVGDLVGDTATDVEAVIGETPNLAARLQSIAGEGQVVIGLTTRHLLGTAFELKDLGRHDLKGFSEAVFAWGVVGESAAESRFEAAHTGTLAHLVGREHELGLLCERWELAKGGEGQVVLLSGEAGIGKSRMVQALRNEIGDEPHFRLRYQCSPHHMNSAFRPVIQRLERAAGFLSEDGGEAKLDKLEALLKPTAEDVAAIAPLFAALLSLPGEDRYGPLDLTPQQLRDRTIEALIDQVLALSRQRPVLFVVEDAHWIDPSTQDLVGEIMARVADQAVFMLNTYRPKDTPLWTSHPHLSSVALNRLGRQQSAEIVQSVGGQDLTEAIVARIVARADGVPMYVEELTKSVVESGEYLSDPTADDQIPTTLQDSLVARLDRLDEAKEIAQVGAIIGRDFSYDLLAAVVDRTEVEINAALDRLIRSGMVFRRGVPPTATYTFKHALVQDAAYATILMSRRQQLHALIVQVIEAQGGDQPIEKIDLLAHHAYQGEDWEKAFTYLRQAGLNALNRSALREAVTQFEYALLAWSHLPVTREAQERAIDLRFDLRNALWSLGAFEDVLANLRDAERLAKTLDDPRRIGWVSVYMSASLWQIGRSEEARTSAETALAIAESGDLALEVAGNHYLGCAYATSGDYRQAETLFLKIAEALVGDLSHEHYGLPFLPAVVSRSWLVWALADRGEFDQGIAHGQEGVRLADELGHPFSQAHVYYDLGYLHGIRGDFDHAVNALERAFALVREWNLTFMSPFIMGFLGHVYALSGRVAEGTSLLQQAMLDYETKGMGFFRSLVGVQLGEASLLAHQVEDASASAERALALARDRDERGHEAHALRLLGEIAAHPELPDAEIAQGRYREALALAETLGMRPLVAHCHLGLGRLYGREGKRQEAEEHVARAVAMYRDMGMRFWHEQANAMG
jgi:class 3 adenylate cyclase/tetratricopeptide (TPR) repeat protein